MPALTLPEPVRITNVQPFLRDFGGVLTPFLGGEELRLNRIGMRLGARFTLAPCVYSGTGQAIVSRLMQAKASRIIVPFPQPGFDPGAPGAPLVASAASGGTSLHVKSLSPGYAFAEGQFINLIRAADSRRYLHATSTPATADGSGKVTLSLFPPMRVTFAVNDQIDVVTPMIEGHVLPGDELNWDISLAHHLGIPFSVSESK